MIITETSITLELNEGLLITNSNVNKGIRLISDNNELIFIDKSFKLLNGNDVISNPDLILTNISIDDLFEKTIISSITDSILVVTLSQQKEILNNGFKVNSVSVDYVTGILFSFPSFIKIYNPYFDNTYVTDIKLFQKERINNIISSLLNIKESTNKLGLKQSIDLQLSDLYIIKNNIDTDKYL